MTLSPRFTLRLVFSVLVAWFAGCSDSPSGIEEQPPAEEAIVSDPVADVAAALGAHGGSAAPLFTAAQAAVETDVVYIALPPRTASNGVIAVLRNPRVGGTVWVSMSDGGFDPVPFAASAGDVVQIEVLGAGGARVALLNRTVPPRRPPRVVRTVPPRGKTDVAINQSIIVVFSEPVAASTLSPSSVQLFQGNRAVPGTVRLLDGTGAIAAFVPTAPLARNTQYRLQVTQAVRDLQGDPLETGMTVMFTTGQSSTGAPASIRVSPDTVFMVGPTYQMTATVRDAAGNILIDQPVAWSTSDPNGLTVSATGLLTARAADVFQVIATVNELTTSAMVFVNPGPAASVVISPNPATVAAGDTIILTAMVRDASGILFFDPAVTWTSSAPAVATVAPYGSAGFGRAFATVTGLSQGSVTITATSGAASGTASVTVGPPSRAVASVVITPASATLVMQGGRRLTAGLRDANGNEIRYRLVSWTSDNAAVATVDAGGVVMGVGTGSTAVIATSEGVSDTASITVMPPINLTSVSSGREHSCALSTTGSAFCWGSNHFGQLGDGSTGCDAVKCEGDTNPWPVGVVGGLAFSSLSLGTAHSCGLTARGAAYCWGNNFYGQLGDGSTTSSSVPVAVTAGPSFVSLSAGSVHTCGLTAAGAAYCWGANHSGQLGAANSETCDSSPCSTQPVPVSGGLTFSMVSAGGEHHTCGVTIAGAAYCWGSNLVGQLGDGTTTSSPVPVAVSGQLTFSSLSVGGIRSCGLITSGAAYCWGNNFYGQLGDGSTNSSSVPMAVSGGLTFFAVSAGGQRHACGLTTSGAAYCWGWNVSGQLGTGSNTGPEECLLPESGLTTPCSKRPVAVTGGLTFRDVSVGRVHSCGTTVARVVYCWGSGAAVGNGSTGSNLPVKVAGQP
jgi:alpha-tubulin suppressor-like RCC1 family protein